MQTSILILMASSPRRHRLMDACGRRPSLHFYAVDQQGNTYSNGSKKATAVRTIPHKGLLYPNPVCPDPSGQNIRGRAIKSTCRRAQRLRLTLNPSSILES